MKTFPGVRLFGPASAETYAPQTSNTPPTQPLPSKPWARLFRSQIAVARRLAVDTAQRRWFLDISARKALKSGSPGGARGAGTALLSVAAAWLVFQSLPALRPMPMFVFLTAVYVSRIAGGTWPALLATVLSIVSIDLSYRTQSTAAMPDDSLRQLAQLGAFGLAASVISVLPGHRRDAVHLRKENEDLRAALSGRMDIEEKLRRVEDEFSDFFESSPVPAHWVGRDGRILRANKAALELVGYSRDECIGGSGSAFFLDPSRFEDMLHRLANGEAVHHTEAQLRTKDGSIKDVVLLSNAFLWEGEFIHSRCFMIDVTERERVREALEKAREAAAAASRAKDEFLAGLSHELRTPLNPAILALSGLEMGPLPEEMRRTINLIRRNVEMEARLIDDLLDTTRLSRGELTLNLETVDAHALLFNVLEICRCEIDAKQLALSVQLTAPRHHVQADPARLQQVFWNLLKNAIRFTNHGGQIRIRSFNDAGRLGVEVTDKGVGIDSAGALSGEPFEGLNPGLTVSRAILQAHGGALTARSDARAAVRIFRVEIATVEGMTAPRRLARSGQEPESGDLRPSVHILLVEDNEDTALTMARLMAAHHYRVSVATSVETALRVASEDPFDLLVSDIGLSDGSGLDLMRALRKKGPIQGIAVSGYGMDEDRRKSQEAGFKEHLTKPIDLQKLLRAIESLLPQEPVI